MVPLTLLCWTFERLWWLQHQCVLFYEVPPPTLSLEANSLSIEARKQDPHESIWQPWPIWSEFFGRPSVQLTSLGQLDIQVHWDSSRQGQVNWKESNCCGQWHSISLWNALLPTLEIILKCTSKLNFYWLHVHFVLGCAPGFSEEKPAIQVQDLRKRWNEPYKGHFVTDEQESHSSRASRRFRNTCSQSKKIV